MRNKKISAWLSNRGLVTDGGWGTELQKLGLPLGAAPDLWNLTEPEKVGRVAARYVAAGSDVILTNTFGANRFLLAKQGAERRVALINAEGVKISREAAKKGEKPVRVFASMGPTGVLLMMGTETIESLEAAFREQAYALAGAGADAIVVETMSDLTEAAAAVRAAKLTGLPVVVSMTFDSGRDKDRTMMGITPEAAAKTLADAGADGIGANCGQGIDGFLAICRRFRAATTLPLWMKGNAGLPEIADGKTTYRQTPTEFAEKAVELFSLGASFVGGCCGTDPDFIAELSQRVAEKNKAED